MSGARGCFNCGGCASRFFSCCCRWFCLLCFVRFFGVCVWGGAAMMSRISMGSVGRRCIARCGGSPTSSFVFHPPVCVRRWREPSVLSFSPPSPSLPFLLPFSSFRECVVRRADVVAFRCSIPIDVHLVGQYYHAFCTTTTTTTTIVLGLDYGPHHQLHRSSDCHHHHRSWLGLWSSPLTPSVFGLSPPPPPFVVVFGLQQHHHHHHQHWPTSLCVHQQHCNHQHHQQRFSTHHRALCIELFSPLFLLPHPLVVENVLLKRCFLFSRSPGG
ncbi:hypothetical protein DFP72DRAFT_110867 [Ephemerocybe angulata]|uniref:Uncharacterized protein n=1 Tax=Ephemerocybe angulata TaxID=980116 RepID=A0A8H6HDK8_9AGAR|nr:hypothetical protein DFP72DRAFT_110867 [Tulosesus angulatus]